MQAINNARYKILLFLPLVLLMLQFGIALLHHHHDNSYYDNRDQFHQVSIDSLNQVEVTKETGLSLAPQPILPSTLYLAALSFAVASLPLKSDAVAISPFGPAPVCPKRAPPA